MRRWPTDDRESFRRHFVGTHFFNPPRYLHLVEIIPTADTDPEVVAAISAFADVRLGKGVVIAKDTPNFIANHIGLYGVMQVFRALATGEYTIEEIDAITGPATGTPEERDVPDDGHRGDRRAGARRAQPRRAAGRAGGADCSPCRRWSTR